MKRFFDGKRFPAGVLLWLMVWALALSLPPVRDLAGSVPVRDLAGSVPVLWSWRSNDFGNTSKPPQVADDPVSLAWNLEASYSPQQRDDSRRFARFDALAAGHPDQLWIRAVQLRTLLFFPFRLDAKTPGRAMSAGELRQVPQWKRAVLVAQQAEKREPDNAFWPWMNAIFRFALRQNAAGVRAMERAGAAARFDDYAASTTRARIKLLEKTGHLTWEQKSMMYYSVPLQHLSPMMGASGAAAIEALNRRKRGDNAGASGITAALLRANFLLRRDSDTFISAQIGESNAREALERLLGQPVWSENMSRVETLEGRVQHLADLEARWARLARDNGRGDLATGADWLSKDSVGDLQSKYSNGDIWSELGLPSTQSRFVLVAPMFLVGVAALCFFLALVWLAGLPSLRAINSTGRGRDGCATPSRGQVVASANFGFWALAGALAVAVKTNWLFELLQPFTSPADKAPFSALFLSAFVLSCWLCPVAFLSWKRDRPWKWVRPERKNGAVSRTARLASWMIFGGCVAIIGGVNTSGQGHNVPSFLGLMVVCVSLASLLCALVLETFRLTRTLPRPQLQGEPSALQAPRALQYARFGAWTIALLCLWRVLDGHQPGFDMPPVSQWLAVPLGVIALAVALLTGRKIGSGDGFGWRLASWSAGVLGFAWSVAFLVLALFLWPMRAQLDHQLDRRISMREEDWAKEQFLQLPPNNPAR
jgi:hypothetical protein